MLHHGKEPFPAVFVDVKEGSEAAKEVGISTNPIFYQSVQGKKYEPIARAQLKKMTKLWQQEVKKAEKRAEQEREAREAQLKRAEDAKKVLVTNTICPLDKYDLSRWSSARTLVWVRPPGPR
jgi:asparaginyl-tRNA synthetase